MTNPIIKPTDPNHYLILQSGTNGIAPNLDANGVVGINEFNSPVKPGSSGGNGVYGYTKVPNANGVNGHVDANNTEGAGICGVGPTAGRFFGNVEIKNELIVSGVPFSSLQKKMNDLQNQIDQLIQSFPPSPPILNFHAGITFPGITALGGWFTLAITAKGDISFSGHFHCSTNIDTYNPALLIIIKTPDGLAYKVEHHGYASYPVGGQANDDDWVINENSKLISDNWSNQFSKASLYWEAASNSNDMQFISNLWDKLKGAAGIAAGAALISLI